MKYHTETIISQSVSYGMINDRAYAYRKDKHFTKLFDTIEQAEKTARAWAKEIDSAERLKMEKFNNLIIND